MQFTTLQGTTLTLGLAARNRVPGGHPQPIVEFRYLGGILCSSYYMSDFMDIDTGLCLVGGEVCRQDIDTTTVAVCKHYINTQLNHTAT